jgi:hypothetical protein
MPRFISVLDALSQIVINPSVLIKRINSIAINVRKKCSF